MKTLELCNGFYWVGIQDYDLRVFDIIMETKFGTTYNSFLLKTDEGVVLFETAKEVFFDDYIEKIKELVDIKDIKYVVCNHTEPDHSGSLERLLELNKDIIIVSSKTANSYIKEIINKEFNSLIVKDNDVLNIGNKTLRFINAINLHWPDSMYTYIEEDKLLVSCDSFGSHYAFDQVLLSKVTNHNDYNEAFDYYTTMIMGPFKPFIIKAMDKIKDLEIKMICCGHGPVIDIGIKEKINQYYDFAKPIAINNNKKVVIPYVSAYGYTKIIATTIKEVMMTKGVECNIYDLTYAADKQAIIDDMISADGIIYGSPTLLNDALPPIYDIMNSIIPSYHGFKKVSAFGSYGWTGEAVENLLVRLKQQKMKIVDDGYRVKFKPSTLQIEEIKAYALNFIDNL